MLSSLFSTVSLSLGLQALVRSHALDAHLSAPVAAAACPSHEARSRRSCSHPRCRPPGRPLASTPRLRALSPSPLSPSLAPHPDRPSLPRVARMDGHSAACLPGPVRGKGCEVQQVVAWMTTLMNPEAYCDACNLPLVSEP